ncbi:hypothetical protein TNCV_732261 [Trichonephila clavipes]|nr:hypothetical protein TNCV_732261 [Trichonephila clavipes]
MMEVPVVEGVEALWLGEAVSDFNFTVTEHIGERNTEFHYAFKEDAKGNLTASCKRFISWFLLYKGTELVRKIVPVRPPKF